MAPRQALHWLMNWRSTGRPGTPAGAGLCFDGAAASRRFQGAERALPGREVLGASTAGEFTERGDGKQGVVACAISGEFRVSAGLGRGLSSDPERAVREAFGNAPGRDRRLSAPVGADVARSTDRKGRRSRADRRRPARRRRAARWRRFGDDLHMKQTHVACGTASESDAVVLAVLHSRSPFGLGVSHGHQPLSGR